MIDWKKIISTNTDKRLSPLVYKEFLQNDIKYFIKHNLKIFYKQYD